MARIRKTKGSVAVFTPEEKLLVLLNLAAPTELELAELCRLAAEPALNWEKLLDLGRRNAVLPLSLISLKKAKAEAHVPAALMEKWEAEAAPIRLRNEARASWGRKMLEALSAAGVEVIVLKGSMFAEEIYHERSYKKMNDIDVLIRREDAERTTAVLRSLGFQSVGALFGKKEISENSHHTPPYVSADMACVVGLHWGLVSPLSPWRPDTIGIWKRKVAIQVADAPAFRMSWEDNLLHLCIHLPFFKTGLRELADVINLVRHARIDWDDLSRRAHRWRAEEPVFRVLSLCKALAELDIPAGYLQRWAVGASRFALQDTRKRVTRPASILYSRSTQAAKIEKAYAIFMLSENYGERMKALAGMYALLLWPKEEELAKLSGVKSLKRNRARWLRARVKAPASLWNAMARDHGHLPLAAMTLINLGSAARDSARQLMNLRAPVGRSLKEHPAAKLLEVLE